jgi:transcriptional regulator with XRE-family HTH domain
LIGVSMQSVYNWERKKATPRKEQLAAIASLRGIGKKAVLQRMDELARTKVAKRSSKKRVTQRRRANTKLAKLKRRGRSE